MSFIGGGFAVAVGNWLHAGRASQKQQEIVQLRDQLKYLYGPLSYITRKNEQLFALSRAVQGVYGTEFIDKEWSADPDTQQRVQEEATATLDLANAYIQQVVENNKKVLEIMEANWHFADLDDIVVFTEFQVDCIRFATEVHGNLRGRTHQVVYRALGNISYMRPALINRIAEKVEIKQEKIGDLLRPWWRSLWPLKCCPTSRSSGRAEARRSP